MLSLLIQKGRGHFRLHSYTYIKTNGTTLALQPLNGTVPAGTGILLQGEGVCQIPVVSGSTTNTAANKLVGVLQQTVKEANSIYVLVQEQGVTGFYRNNNAFTVGAQTAYLPSDFGGGAGARFYKLAADNDATRVPYVAVPQHPNQQLYNLNGQRVSQPTKGLYISNGRKVMVK